MGGNGHLGSQKGKKIEMNSINSESHKIETNEQVNQLNFLAFLYPLGHFQYTYNFFIKHTFKSDLFHTFFFKRKGKAICDIRVFPSNIDDMLKTERRIFSEALKTIIVFTPLTFIFITKIFSSAFFPPIIYRVGKIMDKNTFSNIGAGLDTYNIFLQLV